MSSSKKPKKPRTVRPLPILISALEDQLALLRSALAGFRAEQANIKAITASLRVLVCLSSGTEGLLWRLVEHLGVNDVLEVHAHDGVRLDKPINRSLVVGTIPIKRKTDHLEKHLPSQPLSFREVIKEREAIFSRGKRYTYEELIRDYSQQMGMAHEDDSVDPELLTAAGPALSALLNAADMTLQIGERVLRHAVAKHGFVRRKYSPPVTFAVVGEPAEFSKAGDFERFKSEQLEAEVVFSIQNTEAVWTMQIDGSEPIILSVPIPRPLTPGQAALSALRYRHQERMLVVSNSDGFELVRPKTDLGFWDDRTFRGKELRIFEQVASGITIVRPGEPDAESLIKAYREAKSRYEERRAKKDAPLATPAPPK